MIREAQRQASRKTLSNMVDGFTWGVIVAGVGFAIVGQFSIPLLLCAGIGGSLIEGTKQ